MFQVSSLAELTTVRSQNSGGTVGGGGGSSRTLDSGRLIQDENSVVIVPNEKQRLACK